MIRLTIASLANRRAIAILTAFSVALSVFLFAGVEKLRSSARTNFTSAVSGTHIIAGARSGQIPLLLFSLFHLGSPTSNVSYASYKKYKRHPAVAWAIPLSIGDSHRGFRVVATEPEIFARYKYGDQKPLRLAAGTFTLGRLQAVLGATAARDLGFGVGARLVLTHGISDVQGIHDHDESPFVVEGVLEPTGTPFDKGIYISLVSLELMHETEEFEGVRSTPAKITSFLLGVKEPVDILPLMRAINEDDAEPMTAILPGIVLGELWGMLGYVEGVLKLVSILVMATALMGLAIALYASLAERYRELAILRALGASPLRIASLLMSESVFLALGGVTLGYTLLFAATQLLHKQLLRAFSVSVQIFPLTGAEVIFIGVLLVAALVVALFPAYILYRRALGAGLQANT